MAATIHGRNNAGLLLIDVNFRLAAQSSGVSAANAGRMPAPLPLDYGVFFTPR